MSGATIITALIAFLHDLATVVWIGALISLALITMPAVKKVLGKSLEVAKVQQEIQNRQRPWVFGSLVVLILTGMLLARRNPAFGGLFSMANPYSIVMSIKHILVILMAAIAIYRSAAFGKGSAAGNPTRQKWSARLMLANLILGVGVLLLSGFSSALSA